MVLALWLEDNDHYHSATHAPLVISRLTGNLKYIEPVLLCQLLFLYFDLYVFTYCQSPHIFQLQRAVTVLF